MQRIKVCKWLIGLGAILLIAVCSTPDDGTQFTAVVLDNTGQVYKQSRVFVEKSKYRLEKKIKGQKYHIIVDQITDTTRILLPEDSIYWEMKGDNSASLGNDPFRSLKQAISINGQKHIGTETINSYECDKYEILQQDSRIITQWVARRLNFPVKIVIHIGRERTIYLKKINEVTLDDSLFVIPPGYMKKNELEKQAD